MKDNKEMFQLDLLDCLGNHLLEKQKVEKGNITFL